MAHDPPSILLAELLLGLFDSTELRIHLAGEPGGTDLIHALPGPIATPCELAHTAAEVLKRRGLASRGFFDRLEDTRPAQREFIRKVRHQWLAGDFASHVSPPSHELPPPSHSYELAALASFVGFSVFTLYTFLQYSPFASGSHLFPRFLLGLLVYTLPSVRVFLNRCRNIYIDILHWIWVGFWIFLGFLVMLSENGPGFIGLLLFAISMGLGIYASVAYLMRRRNAS